MTGYPQGWLAGAVAIVLGIGGAVIAVFVGRRRD
jgi:hypothetical protein